MQTKILSFVLLTLLISTSTLKAQSANQDTLDRKFFIGSSLFVLYNAVPDDNSPDFIQFNLGYRISPIDVVSMEIKTWRYGWPLGIPYGRSFEAPEEKFPGYIRERGFALVYQRFWWKGLYTGIHVMNAWQSFVNENDQEIDTGFQLFNTYRLGFQIRLFKNTFFIEPSLAVTHRMYHTEMPDSFNEKDRKWPVYFIGEPGLHIGFNF